MPYMAVGKTIYKKKSDGSRGAKVGTTKGSIKKYMSALHANVKHKKKKYTRKVDNKMRKFGEIDYEKKEIRINPKKGDLINTILHEENHRKDPKLSEKKIIKKTEKQEKNLGISNAIKLLKRYKPDKKKTKKSITKRLLGRK